jgi:hypothetical protein
MYQDMSFTKRNLDSYDLKLNQSEEVKLRRLDDYISNKMVS